MFDKISGSDYTPVSFVSADNKDIGLVQFEPAQTISKIKRIKDIKRGKSPSPQLQKVQAAGVPFLSYKCRGII